MKIRRYFFKKSYEAVIQTDTSFSWVRMMATHDELTIETSQSVSSWDDFCTSYQTRKGIVLVVNDASVLQKTLDCPVSSDEEALQATFPAIKVSEFYIQVEPFDSGALVAICRKTTLDALIKKYLDQGIHVVHYTLGNISASGLSSWIDTGEVYTPNTTIVFKDKQLYSFQKSENTQQYVLVDTLRLESPYVLGIGGILGYFMHTQPHWKKNPHPRLLALKYKQFHYLKTSFVVSIAVLFLSLLTNFFIYTSLIKKKDSLDTFIAASSLTKERLIRITALVEDIERVWKGLEQADQSHVGWYIQQLALSVPNDVWLDNLNYQPLSQRIQSDKAIQVSLNRIELQGKANSSVEVSNWIRHLEELAWVEQVSIVSFGGIKKPQIQFHLLLTIKTNTP